MKLFDCKHHAAASALLALSLLGGVPEAQAGLVLDLNSGGSAFPCGGCGNISGNTYGWAFTVTSGITVDGLGLWDSGSDGIGLSSATGLWTSGGTLLASTTISDGSTSVASASSQGRWLFEDIAPTTLAPGNYLIGSIFFQSVPLAQVNAPFIAIPEITGITGVQGGGSNSGFQAPTNAFGSLIFGPSMRQVTAAVPEPTTLALFAIGGIGLASRRRTKQGYRG